MTGGTITLSSLAALGVDRFTAMVNPGESTIVAVGRTTERSCRAAAPSPSCRP